MQQQARHGVDGPVVPQRGAGPSQAREVDRGAVVHERQGDELREAARPVLHRREGPQVRHPVPGVVDVAVHHRRAARDAQAVRGLHDLDPGAGGQLALGQHPADVVVEDLRGCAGDRAEAGVTDLGEPVGDAGASTCGGADDLHRAERVHVHPRRRREHRPDDAGVGVRAQVGADPGLDAHLGRPEGLRLGRPAPDLGQRQRVGVRVGRALCERAEPAADVADVGHVDVPVDDVGDVVADGVPAHVVGQPGQRLQGLAVTGEQGQVGRIVEPRGVVGGAAQRHRHLVGAEHRGHLDVASLPHGGPVAVHLVEVTAPVDAAPGAVHGGVQVGTAAGDQTAVGLLPRQRRGRRAHRGESAHRVRQRGDMRTKPDVEPARRLAQRGPYVSRVHGQPLRQGEPGLLGTSREVVQVWPGPFGVDVVGGDR